MNQGQVHDFMASIPDTEYELFCKRNGIPLGAHFIIPEVWFLIGSEDG